MADDVLAVMNEFRDFMFERVYLRPATEQQKARAVAVIRDLVDYFVAHPDEIPDSYRHEDAPAAVQAVDYVSGMTDRFALRRHDELFRPEGIV